MQAHLGNCDYRDVQCTQCGQYIQQLDMEAHQKELCAMRPTTCPHCSKDVPTQQLQVSDGCFNNHTLQFLVAYVAYCVVYFSIYMLTMIVNYLTPMFLMCYYILYTQTDSF